MNAYSKDLRLKVLDAVERGIPRREVAQLLGISSSTISRYLKLKASGRQIAPKPSPGRKPKILANPAHKRALWRRDVGQVRDVLRRSDTIDDASSRRVFATVEEAVEAATALRSGNTSQTSTQETP